MSEFLYNSKEIAAMLGITVRTAQSRIREWNKDLKEKGFHIEPGKVPKVYFHELNPYIQIQKENAPAATDANTKTITE